MAKDVRKDILWRAYLVYLAVLIFALVLIGKVVYIQTAEGDYWRTKAKELTIDTLKVEAIRGDICSDDGSLLSTSVPIYEVRIDFGAITKELFNKDVDSLSSQLSKLFKDKSKNEYKQILISAQRHKDRYFLLKRDATYSQLKQLRTFGILKAGKYRGGRIEISKTRRVMPYQNLAMRTVGFERQGISVGIEGAYSTQLKGKNGLSLKQKIAGGIWMPLSDENQIEPQNGNDIISTIDINIQDVAENSLMQNLALHNAHHGCVILMEVQTGYIKAIANLTRSKDGTYVEQFNYAIGESSEPGSTFKLPTMMAALEDGLIDLNETVNTGNGVMKFFDQEMVDSHKGGYGTITAEQAFINSSNVGVSKLLYKSYFKHPEKFISRLYSFGINKPLNLEIGGEAPPYIKNTKSKTWSKVSLPWMSVGYEVRITPMQTLTFYNAVANNGRMVKPLFVKEIRQTGKVIETFNPIVINESICSKSTIEKAKKMLLGVVESGTGKGLKSNLYKIAGKTGTAQIARGNTGYGEDGNMSYKASFVGYFPADNPKYSCIVVINDPVNGTYYGASVAGPVFKEIADKLYATKLSTVAVTSVMNPNFMAPIVKTGNQLDLNKIYQSLNFLVRSDNPSAEWVESDAIKTTVNLKEKKMATNIVPNVVGMGTRDAIYILENAGLKVVLNGRGLVKSQSISAGSKIVNGAIIQLVLTRTVAADTLKEFFIKKTALDKQNELLAEKKNADIKDSLKTKKDDKKEKVTKVKDPKKNKNSKKTKNKGKGNKPKTPKNNNQH
ncbi:MAG: transpeptidase family protein [Bacteroidetes bacterium]|nr:transpeptidase family protein [Bacteroidota bacterium]